MHLELLSKFIYHRVCKYSNDPLSLIYCLLHHLIQQHRMTEYNLKDLIQIFMISSFYSNAAKSLRFRVDRFMIFRF